MAVLTVVKSTLTGANPGFAAAAGGGDSFPNTGNERVTIINGDAGGITVAFDSPAACNLGASANAAHDGGGAVAGTATRVFGPFDPNRFNDANGRVQITYSAVTSVTVAVGA